MKSLVTKARSEGMPPERRAAGSLSAQERAIVQIAARGRLDKEIAMDLGISVHTVRTYWERIRKKLDAGNRAHAIAIGVTLDRLERAGDDFRSSTGGDSTGQFSQIQRSIARLFHSGATDVQIAQDLELTRSALEGEWDKLTTSLSEVSRDEAVALVLCQLLVEARAALEDEHDKLALVIRNREDKAVVTFDLKGEITGVSHHSEKLLGVSAIDLIGTPVASLLLTGDNTASQASSEMSRAHSGEVVQTLTRHTRTDGSQFDARHHLLAIVGPSGEVNGFVEEIHDLSRCKLHEIRIAELDATIALLVEE